MKIEINDFGEKEPRYETEEEELEAINAFLQGRFGDLTALEVEHLRALYEDPLGKKYDADHAGRRPNDFPDWEFNGMVFMNRPISEPWEVSMRKVIDMVGPHPLTRANVYLALRKLDWQDHGLHGLGVANGRK